MAESTAGDIWDCFLIKDLLSVIGSSSCYPEFISSLSMIHFIPIYVYDNERNSESIRAKFNNDKGESIVPVT